MKFFRYFSIVTVFCFVLVLGTNTVYADSYTLGDVTFVGNIDAGTYAPVGNIVVSGQISNSNPYNAIPAYLTATTNGSTQTVVSQQNVAAGSSTTTGQVILKAPSAPGSYSVALSAGANIPASQEIVDFDVSIWNYGVESGTPRVAATVRLARPLSQAITVYVNDEYWDSYVNGPDSVGFSVTIPAGWDGSSMVSVEYINASTISNTYISSNGQYTTVNGVSTNDLLSGTLLTAYGNTVLRLTGANVSYNFQCGPQGGGFSCY